MKQENLTMLAIGSTTMASTFSIDTLVAENRDLCQQVSVYRAEIVELEGMVEAMQKKIRMLLDHVPAGALPAPTLFGAPKSLPGTGAAGGLSRITSLAPDPEIGKVGSEEGWIVDSIPSLHRTYANLSQTGTWTYWKLLPDGRYKWNPQWIEDNE
jgi:hypothetical protein